MPVTLNLDAFQVLCFLGAFLFQFGYQIRVGMDLKERVTRIEAILVNYKKTGC